MFYIVSNNIEAFDRKFKYISIEESLELLNPLDVVGLDTETDGLDCHTKKILTLQLGNKDLQIVYDISSFGGKIPQKIKDYLLGDQLFIIQNAKFDLKFLYKQKIILKNVYDTFLVEQIITHGLQYGDRGLDKLVQKYFPNEKQLDKSVRGTIISKGLTDEVMDYAAMDVVYLPGIREKQLEKVKELDLGNCIALDNSFVKILAFVEFWGMKLDWDKWKEKSLKDLDNTSERKAKLDNWLIENGHTEYTSGMQDMFTNELTVNINWDSQKQVIPLFEKLGIKCEVKEKGVTKKSIDAKKVLALQKNKFEILPLYLDYKESVTLTNTFGLNWKKYINPNTGRVHSAYRQIQDTGRLASGEKEDLSRGYIGAPNMQNIPSDPLTRSCFIAEKGNKLASLDYSSQEQRILANFSKVETLINFYKQGFQDMHSYVAFLMYPEIRPCTLEELTNDTLTYIKKNYHDQRSLAKNAGFAINYGGNGSTISKNCGIPKKQGEFVYNSYFKAFGGLKEYFTYVLERTKKFGYIQFNNVTGRKFFLKKDNPLLMYGEFIGTSSIYEFPNPREIERLYRSAEAEIGRLSQNYPIQGSAADMTKLACIFFFNTILARGWEWSVKIINLVHDEIIIEAPEDIIEEASDLLTKCMEKAGDIFCKIIPLTAEASIGDFWIH